MQNGLLLVNKEPGVTSYKLLTPIKRVLGTKEIGHTGTLDSFAEGLMLILVGPSVALSASFQNMDKEYTAVVRFGQETDTLDPQGAVVQQAQIPPLKDIEAVLPEFTGVIKQRPPEYAAVHVNGKRAWQRKRSGESFELPEREVFVDNISITSFDKGVLRSTCSVSKGTYVRALWRDIARRCSSCAHLTSLCRTRVGKFHQHQASAATTAANIIPPKDFITKVPGLHICYTSQEGEERFRQGKEIKLQHLLQFDAEKQNICCSTSGEVLARLTMHKGAVRYRRLWS